MRQTAPNIKIHRINLIIKYSKQIDKLRFYIFIVDYLLKYRFLSAYTFLKKGSFKSLINCIASPVDFISGPNSLFTLGNFSNEKTGILIA